MNILLIGNGFDIAHGLPTSYKEFLNFVSAFEYCKKNPGKENELIYQNIVSENVSSYLVELFNNKYDNDSISEKEHQHSRTIIKDLEAMIENNIWIKHFQKIKKGKGDFWIDFESEIYEVIRAMDNERRKLLKIEIINKKVALDKFESVFQIWNCQKPMSSMNIDDIGEISSKLVRDLDRLIYALEIYLDDCVNRIDTKKELSGIEHLNIDRLISFNYTNTYERVYKGNLNEEYKDYLHGFADSEKNVNTSNLVLGIDEYLDEPEKTNDNVYIEFKKFFQRIYKKTGCKYIQWLEREEEFRRAVPKAKQSENHLYIIGHSLAYTDHDVLERLIRYDTVRTTIYYHDQKAYANQIAHLVKILHEEDLVSMVYGRKPKIEFKSQSELEK